MNTQNFRHELKHLLFIPLVVRTATSVVLRKFFFILVAISCREEQNRNKFIWHCQRLYWAHLSLSLSVCQLADSSSSRVWSQSLQAYCKLLCRIVETTFPFFCFIMWLHRSDSALIDLLWYTASRVPVTTTARQDNGGLLKCRIHLQVCLSA